MNTASTLEKSYLRYIANTKVETLKQLEPLSLWPGVRLEDAVRGLACLSGGADLAHAVRLWRHLAAGARASHPLRCDERPCLMVRFLFCSVLVSRTSSIMLKAF